MPSRSPRPLSVKVIILYLVIGSVMPNLFIDPTYWSPIFGVRVEGWPAIAHELIFSVTLPLIVAVGLWRLSDLARRWAIGLSAYWMLNSLLMLANPHLRAMEYAEVYDPDLSRSVNIAIDVSVTVLIFAIEFLVIWFLIKRKPAFSTRRGG